MDQIQQKALNALEPYILLAKSANAPQAAAQVVAQATSAPHTFVFAELLQTPNIHALRDASSEQASYHSLLQIFAWGTWSDYSSDQHLPKLSDQQALKLRQISLITISSNPQRLTYQHLQQTLSLSSTRALEDLIISAIYAGLITAKLDTQAQRVDISSVAPLRDLRPTSVPEMISVLENWDSRCKEVLVELEGQIREVRQKALRERRRGEANQKATAKMMDDREGGKGKGGGKRAVAEENEEMDIDEIVSVRTRNSKRGGGLFKGFGRKLGGGG